METYYVLKRVGNGRYFHDKTNPWDDYTNKINLAKWFGTEEKAEEFRLRRREPDKWVVEPFKVALGEKDVIKQNAEASQTPANRLEVLESTIKTLFPELGTVGAKLFSSDVMLYKPEQYETILLGVFMQYTVTYLNHRTWKRTVQVEADSISEAWSKVEDGETFIDCELVADKSELIEATREPDWEAHAAVTMGAK